MLQRDNDAPPFEMVRASTAMGPVIIISLYNSLPAEEVFHYPSPRESLVFMVFGALQECISSVLRPLLL
jgi:hypothetical protein